MADFRVIDANAAALAVGGARGEAYVGRLISEVSPGFLTGPLAPHWRAALSEGTPIVLDDFEYRYPATGERCRFDVRGVVVGERLIYSWRDVTDRHDLLERYRLLAENASDVVYRASVDLILEWVSPSVTQLLGWAPEDLVGRHLVELVNPDDLGPIADAIATNPPGTSTTTDVRARTKQGGWRWVSIFGRGIVGDDGAVTYYVGGARDAASEHDQREALAASESRYRLLAENATDVVAVADGSATLTWVSESVATLLGWSAEQLVGSSVLDLIHSDDLATVMVVTQRLASGEAERYKARMRTVGGDYRWVSVRVRQFTDPGGEVRRIGAWRDAQEEVESRLAMEESEARYRTLAENASDVVLLVDNDYVIRWASPSVTPVLGWNPQDVVGRSRGDFVMSGDLERITEARGRGDESTVEIRARRADGSTIWMSSRSAPIAAPRAGYGGRVVALRDIDAEVRARDERDASETRYRLLAENATDVVYQVDNNDVVLWASPSFPRVLGWDVEDVVGRRSPDLIHPDDLEALQSHRDAVLRGETERAAEVRYVDRDGRSHWMAREIHPIRDRQGRVTAHVIGLRAVDAEVEARESLRRSEERFRLLAEHASDIVVQTDDRGVVEWVSPSVDHVLGIDEGDVVGRELLDFVVPEDREKALAWRSLVHLGTTPAPHEYRYATATGEARWMSVRSEPVVDESGRLRAVVVALRDAQSEVLARRAVTTLSEGSRVLARADREDELLGQMCQVAVDEAGYAFAWYGRKVRDESHAVAKVAMSRHNRRYLDDAEISWADVATGQGPVGRALRHETTVVAGDFRADPKFEPWMAAAAEHGFRSAIAVPVRVGGEVDGAFVVYASEPGAFDAAAVSMFEDLAGELGVGLDRLRDRDRLIKSLDDQALLTSAIEQAGEAIVLTDPASNITYANPAVARISGYEREELIGANPRVFQSGHHPHEFYLDMWSTLLSGRTWRGVLVNRGKSGSLFEEDATISPIHDANGALVAYVAVKHDLTAQRRLEASLDQARTDHDTIVAVMRDVQPADTVHGSAGTFCEAATRLSGIDAAAVLILDRDRSLLPVGIHGSALFDPADPEPVALTDFNPATDLFAGPLAYPLDAQRWTGNERLLEGFVSEGLSGLVLAPIRWQREVVGLLALGARGTANAAALSDRLTLCEELGSYAGTLFGAQVQTFEQREAVRARLRDVLDHGRFHPVFQSVVDLATGRVVGYEALTRFDDGSAPDAVFAEAHTVGLGTDLESACAASALSALSTAGREIDVSLNFSPAALLEGSARRAVSGWGRPVVIEVTEHAPIENFAAVRRAVADIPHASLAVDDAGAGFASLHHILELHPEYVKLDVTIVRDIDADQVRQAMAAGLCHFARLSGAAIVAEGIETEAEADTLRELGAPLGPGRMLGQGYYFGRGQPAAAL